jgi:serine/threonine protein kinase
MATVYLAQDLRHGRSVAVKVLQPELAHAIGPGRFLREIEIAARLSHPNILPLHDSGDADGLLYYVMPYIEGSTLRDRLSRERTLPLEEAVQIATNVAAALTYAHSHGVVHRDIKPENILLTGGQSVVADFGIAHAIDAAGATRLTETGLNSLFQGLYAMDLMYARRFDDAIELLQAAVKTEPNNPVALATLRSAYHQKGMHKEALEVWKASFAARKDAEAEAALDRGYAEAGYSGALNRVAEMLVLRSRTSHVTPWQIGTLFTRAGKHDQALDWLEKAYEAHDPNMPYLSVDPIFDDLRDDPRFQDLLRKLNLPVLLAARHVLE